MTNPELNNEVEGQLKADYFVRREFELDQELKEAQQEINAGRRWFVFGAVPTFIIGSLGVVGGVRELIKQAEFNNTTTCPTPADIEHADGEVEASIEATRSEGITTDELKTVDLFLEKKRATKTLYQFCEEMDERKKEALDSIRGSFWPLVLSAAFGWGYVSNKLKEYGIKKEARELENLKSEPVITSSQKELHSE